MLESRIDEARWVRCGRCGHKLMRIVGNEDRKQFPVLELKCHSCKTVNVFGNVEDDEREEVKE